MGESEEIEIVVDSTPSWRRKGRVIVAASLVSVAPLVVGVMALAVGDEPAAVMAATATSVTAITDPPETTTTSSTTTTSTTSTTTSTTTTTTAPTQPPSPPSTAPLPPLSVSIRLEGPLETCYVSDLACYYILPTVVGVSGAYTVVCHGSAEVSLSYVLSFPEQLGIGYCWASRGWEAEVWMSVEWNGQVAISNKMHLP